MHSFARGALDGFVVVGRDRAVLGVRLDGIVGDGTDENEFPHQRIIGAPTAFALTQNNSGFAMRRPPLNTVCVRNGAVVLPAQVARPKGLGAQAPLPLGRTSSLAPKWPAGFPSNGSWLLFCALRQKPPKGRQ